MKNNRMNNAGFSLIEVIVALGISSFIILAAYMMMNSATRSYSTQSEDIEAQREVQQSLNFLYDKLTEAKTYKVLNQTFSYGSDTVNGLILIVSNTVYDNSGGTNEAKDVTSIFTYIPKRKGGAIYYESIDAAFNSMADSIFISRANAMNSDDADIHLLAENVTSFNVTPTAMVSNMPITVSIRVDGLRTGAHYVETKTIYSRNYVPTPPPEV